MTQEKAGQSHFLSRSPLSPFTLYPVFWDIRVLKQCQQLPLPPGSQWVLSLGGTQRHRDAGSFSFPPGTVSAIRNCFFCLFLQGWSNYTHYHQTLGLAEFVFVNPAVYTWKYLLHYTQPNYVRRACSFSFQVLETWHCQGYFVRTVCFLFCLFLIDFIFRSALGLQ